MKKSKFLSMFLLTGLLFSSCSSDDDALPEPVNEEEVITTVALTLVPEGDGQTITITYQDLDGDGPNAPVTNISGNLISNTTYSGSVVVLNELESPAENITEEVEEEGDEHQFFYTVGSSLDATVVYTDEDEDGNPVGITFDLITGEASSGNLTVTLRHEPNKAAAGVSEGNIANAGGDTDVEATFSIEIEE